MQGPVRPVSFLIRPALSSLGQPPKLSPTLGPAHLTRSTGVRSRSRSCAVVGRAERGTPGVRTGARTTTFPDSLEGMGRDVQSTVPAPAPVQSGGSCTGFPPIRGRPTSRLFPFVGLDAIDAREQGIRLPRCRVRLIAPGLIQRLRFFCEDRAGDLFRSDVGLFLVGAREELDTVRPS